MTDSGLCPGLLLRNSTIPRLDLFVVRPLSGLSPLICFLAIGSQSLLKRANKYSIIGPDRKRQSLSYQLEWLLTKCLKGVKKCFGSTRSQVRILSPRSVIDRFPSLSFLMPNFCCPQECPQKLDEIREVKGFSDIYIQSRWCM